jgi:ABC-type transport system involved in cytochrome c biogenesis permease subunit
MLLGAVLLLLPKNRVELWRSGVAVSVMAVVAFAFIYITLVSVGYFERKMVPALHSPWFGPHIVVYMVGYSCLALATVAALFRRQAIADLLVRPGLSFLTFGMLFGAFWAKEAWGTYWSWDPKETWAAATWTLYVAYLHLRTSRPRAQGAAAVLLVVAFVCLQMCWWGVNYLPSAQATSVHTYTS